MKVYKNYSHEELNNQYNNRLHVPSYADYFDRWEKLSRQTETAFTVVKNIFFGEHPNECVDIFPAKNPLAKTIVFIHGGYWYLLDKSLFHFLAPAFLQHNITTVFINYPLAPAASIDDIVSSCSKAISWLHVNIKNFNGDPLQMHIMGHSAGAHLASMLLTSNDFYFLKGVISLSGLFNLKPVMLSYINEMVGMNEETAKKNSLIYLQPANNGCPLLLVTGSDETDEFKAQSREMYNSWVNKHHCIESIEIAGKNHYSILDAVTEKNSLLQTAVFTLMNIEC